VRANQRRAPEAIAQALSPLRVFVREERETKTAKSRQWDSNGLATEWPLMFLKRSDSERELAEGSSLERR
jgi:hypothetical protein